MHPLHELECGRVTETAFVESLRAALSAMLGRDVDLATFADTLWEGLFPNEAMIAFMAALRDEGYRMALLTNNVREWELRWRALAPVDDIFELVVDSAFVGVRKPDPEIYELAVSGLGAAAGRVPVRRRHRDQLRRRARGRDERGRLPRHRAGDRGDAGTAGPRLVV